MIQWCEWCNAYILCCIYVAVKISFSQEEYTAVESVGYVRIRVISSGGRSNNPVVLTVIPAEQSPISGSGRLYVWPLALCYVANIFAS